MKGPYPNGWHPIPGRTHEECGGPVMVNSGTQWPPTMFIDDQEIICHNCGTEGLILCDDGGIDLVWSPTTGDDKDE